MRNLLLSAAFFGSLGLPAYAQSTDGVFRAEASPAEVLASDLIGMQIYATETEISGGVASGVQADWEEIGEVNDVILSREGMVEAVLVDIGGFLGMGERRVAVQMSALRFLSDDATPDSSSDFFLVLNSGRAALEGAPVYDDMEIDAGTMEKQPAAEGGLSDDQPPVPSDKGNTAAVANTTDGTTDGTMTTDAPTGTEVVADSDEIRNGYTALAADKLTAESLEAAMIFDSNENRIGEVSDLVLDESGKVTQVVVDLGGFLGIGEKRVALPLEEVEILKATDGDTIRVYVPYSKEQLTNMPNYES